MGSLLTDKFLLYRLQRGNYHQRFGSTIVDVTHDQIEAMAMTDRIIVLRGGIVEQICAPLQLYDHPDNVFVARFLDSSPMNFLSGLLIDKQAVSVAMSPAVYIAVLPLPGSLQILSPYSHKTFQHLWFFPRRVSYP